MSAAAASSLPALRLSGVRGHVWLPERPGERLRVAMDSAVLRATEPGLRACIPPGAPVSFERVAGGCIYLRLSLPLVSAVARVAVFVSPEGLLGLDLTGVEAGGLFGIPASLAAAAVREFLPTQPWLHQRAGTRWDVDPARLLAPYGIEPAPLQAVSADHGVLELRFGSSP